MANTKNIKMMQPYEPTAEVPQDFFNHHGTKHNHHGAKINNTYGPKLNLHDTQKRRPTTLDINNKMQLTISTRSNSAQIRRGGVGNGGLSLQVDMYVSPLTRRGLCFHMGRYAVALLGDTV